MKKIEQSYLLNSANNIEHVKIKKKKLTITIIIASTLILFAFLYQQKTITNSYEKRLDEISHDLDEVKSNLASIEEEVKHSQKKNDELVYKINRYKLKKPSRVELDHFLSSDTTSENTLDSHYVCIHFSRDLKRNAVRAGLNLSYVTVNYSNIFYPGLSGRRHALNGALLNDGTFVYIEPQTDKVYNTLEEAIRESSPLTELNEYEEITINHVSIIW